MRFHFWTRFRLLVLCVIGLVGLTTASCGFNVQTVQPYAPAVGVNVNVGGAGQVQVRNLAIITDEGGRGLLSATLLADRPDALVAVSGQADALDGDGAPLQVTVPKPVDVAATGFVVLTDLAPIELTGTGLQPGLTAQLTLSFRDAGSVTIRVPVMSTDLDAFDEVTEFESR